MTRVTSPYKQIPNVLSAFRLAAIVPLTLLSLRGETEPFAVLLFLAYLSDVLDGWIARRYSLTSGLGRGLDALADNLFFPAILIWFYLLGVEGLDRAVPLLASGVAYILIIQAVSLIRFGRPESLHLWTLRLIYFPAMAIVFYSVLSGRLPQVLLYLLAVWLFLGFTEKLVILLLVRGPIDFEITSILQLNRRP